MMQTKPHACGVDAAACLSTPRIHALGVDDDGLGISLPFPVPFSAWVRPAKRYWVTLAKRRSVGAIDVRKTQAGWRVVGFDSYF